MRNHHEGPERRHRRRMAVWLPPVYRDSGERPGLDPGDRAQRPDRRRGGDRRGRHRAGRDERRSSGA